MLSIKIEVKIEYIGNEMTERNNKEFSKVQKNQEEISTMPYWIANIISF